MPYFSTESSTEGEFSRNWMKLSSICASFNSIWTNQEKDKGETCMCVPSTDTQQIHFPTYCDDINF